MMKFRDLWNKNSLTVRIGMLLSIFMILSVVSYMLISWTVNAKKHDSLQINMAGRQRMLAQKYVREINLVLVGLAISDGEMVNSQKSIAAKTAELFEITLNAFLEGGKVHTKLQSQETTYLLPVNDRRIRGRLKNVDREWIKLREAVTIVLHSNDNFLSNRKNVTRIQAQVARIVLEMDDVVMLMERDSEIKLERIRTYQLLMLGVGSVLFICIIIFVSLKIVSPLKQVENRLKEEGERRFSSIVKSANDAIIVADNSGNIVLWNKAAEKIFGFTMDEMIGESLELIIPERYRALHQAGMNRFIETGQPKIMGKKTEVEGLGKNGKEFPIELSLASWQTEEGLFFTSIIRDVTERKHIEKKMEHLAFYDFLTGLPNRVMFIERLTQELNRVSRNNEKLAVMFIDLDRFKNVNDTLGHDIGDLLLIEVAKRLKQCVRMHDTVARLGGDEFTMLLTQTKDPQNAAVIAENIINTLKPVFDICNYKIYSTPSIGISIYPENGKNVKDLLKNADTAMYNAKEHGRNNYKFCTPDMNEKISKLMRLETGLCEAIENKEFALYYQPQIDINTGEMIGMEALLRWNYPKKGVIPPGEFIPIAEETGIIIEISEWVLQTACKQNKTWQEAGYKPITVAVNISARHFYNQNLEGLVRKTLEAEMLTCKWLELEITETCIIENTLNAVETLRNLKDIGVQLSLDDFGTGYSSLSYLKRLPINTIKIDHSFVSGITTNRDNAAIAKAIITMAHEMGLKVVAEGIETSEQFQFLRQLKCDIVQGYLISHPLSVEDFTKLLDEGKPLLPPLLI